MNEIIHIQCFKLLIKTDFHIFHRRKNSQSAISNGYKFFISLCDNFERNTRMLSVKYFFDKQMESLLIILYRAIGRNNGYYCFTFRWQWLCAVPRFFPVIWKWSLTFSSFLPSPSWNGISKTQTFSASPYFFSSLVKDFSVRTFFYIFGNFAPKILKKYYFFYKSSYSVFTKALKVTWFT